MEHKRPRIDTSSSTSSSSTAQYHQPKVKKPKSKWYCVTVGRNVGVFTNWDECRLSIEGVKGARFTSYPTYEEAKTAFVRHYIAKYRRIPLVSSGITGNVAGTNSAQTSAPSVHPPVELEQWRTCIGGPDVPFYCTDAACNNPAGGRVEFRCVFAKDKSSAIRQVFAYGPFEIGSNNIGEYLGLVRALMWLEEQKIQEAVPIYTDSMVAINWVTRKHASNSHLARIDAELAHQLVTCDAWVSKTNMWPFISLHVRHWNTEKWGEIPADYDRKK